MPDIFATIESLAPLGASMSRRSPMRSAEILNLVVLRNAFISFIVSIFRPIGQVKKSYLT